MTGSQEYIKSRRSMVISEILDFVRIIMNPTWGELCEKALIFDSTQDQADMDATKQVLLDLGYSDTQADFLLFTIFPEIFGTSPKFVWP
jgi:hypothetical protein